MITNQSIGLIQDIWARSSEAKHFRQPVRSMERRSSLWAKLRSGSLPTKISKFEVEICRLHWV